MKEAITIIQDNDGYIPINTQMYVDSIILDTLKAICVYEHEAQVTPRSANVIVWLIDNKRDYPTLAHVPDEKVGSKIRSAVYQLLKRGLLKKESKHGSYCVQNSLYVVEQGEILHSDVSLLQWSLKEAGKAEKAEKAEKELKIEAPHIVPAIQWKTAPADIATMLRSAISWDSPVLSMSILYNEKEGSCVIDMLADACGQELISAPITCNQVIKHVKAMYPKLLFIEHYSVDLKNVSTGIIPIKMHIKLTERCPDQKT